MADINSGQGNPDPKASKSFRDDMKAAEIAARDLAKDMSYVRESLKDSAKELNKIAALNRDYVGASKKLAAFAKDSVALSKDLSALYDSELQTKSDQVLKQTMLNSGLRGEYAQTLATAVLEGKMNKAQLTAMQEELSARQHITEQVAKSTELIETMAAWQEELHEELEGYSMGWEKLKSKVKAIATDPKVAKAFFAAEGIKTAIEGLEGMEKRFDALKKSGLSAGQAAEGMVKTISAASVLGLSDTEGVMAGVVEHYGNVNALSGDMVNDLGKMAVHMGITGQEALKLNAALSQMPGETAETAKNAMEHVGHLAEMEGIAPGKIMKDMATGTVEMARAGGKGAEAFGKSVINLHKMGVELGTASKMADSLLDFESRINNQMEASVLLGKQINLDKAAELALNNDLEGAVAEVTKNIGGSAEFTKMNRLQQDALAKSVGMTVEEMTKYIDAQEEQSKYHGEASSTWMNIVGYGMEYGSKVGGFLKEHGLLLLSGLSVLKQYGGPMAMLKDGWSTVTGAIGTAAKGIKGLATGGLKGMKEAMGGGKDVLGGAADKTKDLASKAPGGDGAAKGKGTQGFLEGLGSGLASFGKNFKDILRGAATLAGSAILIGGALVGLAVAYKAFGGDPMTLIGLGVALAGFGASAALLGKFSSSIMKGALAMLVLGTALIPAAIAFSMLEGVDVNSIIAFSIALPLLALAAAGLGFLIVPITIGAVALAILGAALIPFAIALRTATPAMESFGNMIVNVLPAIPPIITAVADGFVKMFGAINMDNIGPILLLGPALLGIAAGLGAMALTGLAALPVIGALTGLALVAPALTALADSLGGIGGGGEKGGDEKMDTLITKIDELISISKQGGVVMLDGNKVGQALGYSIRRNINTSGVS